MSRLGAAGGSGSNQKTTSDAIGDGATEARLGSLHIPSCVRRGLPTVAAMQQRSALSQAAKSHSECARVAMAKDRVERETDGRRVEQRRKQVEKGMQTAE